jgi:hypothetical protein
MVLILLFIDYDKNQKPNVRRKFAEQKVGILYFILKHFGYFDTTTPPPTTAPTLAPTTTISTPVRKPHSSSHGRRH